MEFTIATAPIDGHPIQVVSAREVHANLEVCKDFSNWVKAQIDRARLVENRDFIKVAQKGELSSTGQTSIEYYLTIDAAKHIAMLSGTDKGFEVREYFIGCERKLFDVPKFDPATLTRIDILKLAMESEEARIKAEAERDHAIATKAQIGSRREATAMARVATANKEVTRLMDRLGFNAKHATIKAVESATKRSFGPQGWRPLSEWCKTHGIKAVDVPDPLYGSVKSWPADAWGEIYDLDLTVLFADKAAA